MAVPSRGTDAALGAAAAARDAAAAWPPTEGPYAISRHGLDRRLWDEPYQFSFFQAIRALNWLYRERHPVGYGANPGSEVVRFHAHASFVFPPSEIVDFLPPKSLDRPPRMVVAFMGLTGPSGALPRYYTETILARVRAKDHALREFLDLFNHRLISLFYRAWEKYRYWLGYERAELESIRLGDDPEKVRWHILEQRPRLDRFGQCLLDLAGVGTAGVRYRVQERRRLVARRQTEDETLRFYAGLLAQRHRSAIGLATMLEDYFDLPVEVAQLWGQWLQLDPENQSCLSLHGMTRLGVNSVAGERIWDVQGMFRVRLGPLDYRQFSDFLPQGSAFRPLAHLTRLYVGAQFDFDVQLVLRGSEAPWCQLGGDGGARLGWNTWIRSQPFTRDLTDAVFLVREG